MAEMIEFSIGCRRCENLVKISKGTYLCTERCHMDDTDVVPIRDGKQTDDWCICNGESYKRLHTTKSKTS